MLILWLAFAQSAPTPTPAPALALALALAHTYTHARFYQSAYQASVSESEQQGGKECVSGV